MKKKILLIIAAVIVLLFCVRKPMLIGLGSFLIKEDSLSQCDAIFVLSGDAYDRGNEAAKLYQEGYAKLVICPGGNMQKSILALGLHYYESEMTKIGMISKGVPDSNIVVIKKGTSTFEEGQAIIDYCKQKHLHKIIVVSSLFHTRRINNCFRSIFKANNISLILYGAHSSDYTESLWWQSENGLIMVNNEYIKLVYYFFKY